MQIAHCSKVYFYHGWGHFKAEVGDEEHKCFFSGWENTTLGSEPAMLETKVTRCVDYRTVCCSSVMRERFMEWIPHMLIQGSCVCGDGSWSTLGAAWRNTCILKRDRASAITFDLPGMCLAVVEKLCSAEQKNS